MTLCEETQATNREQRNTRMSKEPRARRWRVYHIQGPMTACKEQGQRAKNKDNEPRQRTASQDEGQQAKTKDSKPRQRTASQDKGQRAKNKDSEPRTNDKRAKKERPADIVQRTIDIERRQRQRAKTMTASEERVNNDSERRASER